MRHIDRFFFVCMAVVSIILSIKFSAEGAEAEEGIYAIGAILFIGIHAILRRLDDTNKK